MNEDVMAAVRSLEGTRQALARQILSRSRTDSASASPRPEHFADAPQSDAWSTGVDAAFAAIDEAWRKSGARNALEAVRSVAEPLVRRKPWQAMAVAALVGAIFVRVAPLRRFALRSGAGLAWRTLGFAALTSFGWRWFEASSHETVQPSASKDEH